MSRKTDLEQLIRGSYEIIREYEQTIQTSNRPDEKLRARREIDKQWAHIAQYWQEYVPLAGRAVPPDVAEIAAGVAEGSAALRDAYLRHVMEKAGYLTLSGMDPRMASDAQSRLELNAVYTALLTLTAEGSEEMGRQRGGKTMPTAEWLTGRETRRLSALAQLDRCQRLVLLGDPGSGKSTFVNFVALCLAGEALGLAEANLQHLTEPLPPEDDERDKEKEPERQPWRHGALLPVRVVLRDLAARGLPAVGQRADAQLLCDFVAAELERAALGDFVPLLQQELRDQGGLLLLDGLDEVPEAGLRRAQIRQMVASAIQAFPRCRVLVTSRTYAYQQQDWKLPGFSEAVLAPFGRGQIERFVDRWYVHIGQLRGLHPGDAQGRAELLKRAIQGSDRLRGLAERPLLLTLMASLHAWRGGSLPEKREELYADTVDLLLDWWESQRVVREPDGKVVMIQPSLAEWLKVDRDRVRVLLNELAYRAHRAQPELTGTADVAEGDLLSGLMRLNENPEVNPARLVEYLSQRAGLLLPRGVGVYTFPHRTFQEYLAACHLTAHEYPDLVADLARGDPNRWREVALLAGAATTARGSDYALWALVEALCFRELKPEETQDAADAWGALLAGQALAENGSQARVSERNRPKLARVVAHLVRILEEGRLPAVERALTGNVLARLGDPRPGVTAAGGDPRPGVGVCVVGAQHAVPLPDIVWCEVPAGPFLMGSADDDKQASDDERPQRTVSLSTLYISRYPVTNAQFGAFVQAGGYREERFWSEAVRAGYWRDGAIQARWDNRPYTAPHDYGDPFNLPNHPVVGVTWYEAVAFCRWLTELLRGQGKLGENEEIALPDEAQWEKAARGDDGRVYPWGDEPDPNKANYDKTGIGATSAVGCFPGGASPYGAEDMSGNVWEWVGDGRVVRGGAFVDTSRDVRCASRVVNFPGYRSAYFGFRVVASPVLPR